MKNEKNERMGVNWKGRVGGLNNALQHFGACSITVEHLNLEGAASGFS